MDNPRHTFTILNEFRHRNGPIIRHITYTDTSANTGVNNIRSRWIYIKHSFTFPLDVVSVSHNVIIFKTGVLLFPSDTNRYIWFNNQKYYVRKQRKNNPTPTPTPDIGSDKMIGE